MSSDSPNAMLSPSDVADLAGVKRPVVSNWRKRTLGFPDPVAGTEAKPLFSRDAVVDWLRQRGHQVVGESAGGRLWSALNAIRDRVKAEDAADFVLYLAVAKRAPDVDFDAITRAHPADQGELLISAAASIRCLPGMADVSPPARAVLDLKPNSSLVVEAIARTEEKDLAEAVDFVLERLSRWQIKGGSEFGFVGSRTSKVLASLVGDDAQSVLDPACGIANVLIDVAESGSKARLFGSDQSSAALSVAAQRAFLRGVQLELLVGDVLELDPTPELLADVVVAEPPFGMAWDPSSKLADSRFSFGVPPSRSSDLAWVQHAIAHLTDGGKAYVLTSPGALLPVSIQERQIRANLLSAGCIEAIVSLPQRMLPHTSIGPVLWVLRREGEPDDVLLIDGSAVDDIEHRLPTWILEGVVEEDVPHARVAVTELLVEGAALTPAKWLGDLAIDAEAVRVRFTEAVGAIRATIDGLDKASLEFDGLGELPKPRIVTVRELIDNGVVELRTGRSDKVRDREFEDSVVRAQDVKARKVPANQVGLGDFRSGDVTKPGDVLVTTMNEVRSLIDDRGGHLCSTGVDRLRVIDPAVLDPAYLAGVITGSWNARFQSGSTIQRAPIRELEIPLIPARDQAAVVEAWSTVRRVEEKALVLLANADQAQAAIFDAVRYDISLELDNSVGRHGQDVHDSKDPK